MSDAVKDKVEEEGLETPPHWIDIPKNRTFFWATAKGEHVGLSETEVHIALGVQHVREYQRDMATALALCAGYARAKAVLQPVGDVTPPTHHEAGAVAWADVWTPNGERIDVTYRQGATAADLVNAAETVATALEVLRKRGYNTVTIYSQLYPALPGIGREDGPDNGRPARQAKPAQPPKPQPVQAAGQGDGDGPTTDKAHDGHHRITCLKTGLTNSGVTNVGFWAGRKYAEITWSLGGAKLLDLAPWLGEPPLSLTAEHLDTAGKQYPCPCVVFYKNGKEKPGSPGKFYQDIVDVRPAL